MPPRHVLVINRWPAPLAAYDAFLAGVDARVSYITVATGIPPAMRAHAAALEVVVDPGDLRQLVNALCRVVAVARSVDGVVALATEDVLAAAELRQLLDISGEMPADVLAWTDRGELRRRLTARRIPYVGGRAPRGFVVDALAGRGGLVVDARLPGRAPAPSGVAPPGALRDLAGHVARALGLHDQAFRLTVRRDGAGRLAVAGVAGGVHDPAHAAACARSQALRENDTRSSTASVSAAIAASIPPSAGAVISSVSPASSRRGASAPLTVTEALPAKQ